MLLDSIAKRRKEYKRKMVNVLSMLLYIKRRYELKRDIVRKKGRIGSKVKLSIGGDFICGKEVVLNDCGIDLPQWSHITVAPGAILEIGDHSGLSQFSIDCKEHIKIGKHVNIGAGCLIMDSNFHSTDYLVRRDRSLDKRLQKTAPIVIEDDVFIGARSIICKGVTIGARSIIAAGSVVVKDIPSDCIAGGNPCNVIKKLT